jgi:glucokinase
MREGRVLAVDLGGTHLRAAIVDPYGTVLARRVQPTPRSAECPDAVVEITSSLLKRHRPHQAVIGVPGRVNYSMGQLEHAPNRPANWAQWISKRRLEEVLGIDVSLANDADMATVGEAWFGAGRGRDDVVYLTVSTGIGAGVVLGRRLMHGRRSIAEVGHNVIERAAMRAGQPSTLEDLGSGTALGRLAAAAGLGATGPEIVALARAGNPVAGSVWSSVVEAVAIGATNLAHLFAPEVIVIGGGVGLTGRLLTDPVKAWLKEHGPVGLPHPIDVSTAALGDDAGLAGAAGWDEAFGRRSYARHVWGDRPKSEALL